MSAPHTTGPLQRAWPHVRVVLIAIHLYAIMLLGMPSPSGTMRRSAWKDPTPQAEFATWAGRLSSVGLEITPPQLEELLWTASVTVNRGLDRLTAPFKPYYRGCGTWQSWKMFSAPHRHPARLEVDVREGDAWRTVYVARSAEHAWMARELDHDRFRAAVFRYAWPQYKHSYDGFARWLAARAAEDFPDATAVRVHFFKYTTLSPEQVRAREAIRGEYVLERKIPLGRGE